VLTIARTYAINLPNLSQPILTVVGCKLRSDNLRGELTHSRSEIPSLKGSTMNDRKDEAERLFNEPKPATAVSQYEREQRKIHANLERLRKERLAREATSKQS
jgi:hypothetical protein